MTAQPPLRAHPPEDAGTDHSSSAARAYQVLRALLELGPGAHPLSDVITSSGLPRSSVHRILQSGVHTGTYTQPKYGHYAVAPTPQQAASSDFLTALPARSPAISEELGHLQRRTGQVAAIHSQLLIGVPTRVCVEVAHGRRSDFAAALSAEAGAAFRQAPLHVDAAGLVILANLDDGAASAPILRRIRIQGHAVTRAPLAGWSMLSVPLRRGNILVGSISLLAPEAHLARRTERITDVTMDAAAAMARHLEHVRAIRHVLPPLVQAC
ncbi:helix-turn-helix domain-containing protein [Kitasatospora sp. NPDC048540]|uniref:helix-turn-helix domain-containing protein n=1 Tax=Kitasatospora sp. NPDC048540 TaxID=3155634 RepID=UPI0033CE3F5B